MDEKYTKKAQVGDVIIIDEKKALEYIVIQAELEGGGTGHGPHDIYPDGWHVKARKLNSGRIYNPQAEAIDFYQSGSFTNMKETVELVGKMEQTFVNKEDKESAQKIYTISTEGDCEGKSTSILGYATGDIEDIRLYYNDRKNYNLYVDEISVLNVKPESIIERTRLLQEKTSLEKRLEDIRNLT
ncbi:MAG: hypothetical protein U9R34_00400, partial [Nanoarchaeota archaeon]|nr:hypothetical protein [Nanoarchaeota archaeon]